MREMPESPPLFLSYVPERAYSEQYKMHEQLRHAKAALTLRTRGPGCRGGKIFHWQSGRWELIYDVPPRTLHADLPWTTPI